MPNLYFPVKLPEPLITIISDPWKGFAAHLRGHGMVKEAGEVGHTTPDWVLSQLPAYLHDETIALQGTLRSVVELGGELPEYVDIATKEARSVTHLLALTDSSAATPEEGKRGMLLPIHGLIYASNLVSLSTLGPSAIYDDEERADGVARIPVVKVSVPSPAAFGTLHRYLYTRCPATLLSELVPLRFLSRNWLSGKPDSRGAMEKLSLLPIGTLLNYARLVQQTWANAVAVGVPDRRFWAIMDRAWDMLVGSVALHRSKRLDAELVESIGQVKV